MRLYQLLERFEKYSSNILFPNIDHAICLIKKKIIRQQQRYNNNLTLNSMLVGNAPTSHGNVCRRFFFFKNSIMMLMRHFHFH